MNVSVKRVRIWLLVGAGLLVLVIGGFLGYARYRAHRFLAGLPAKLGVDIQREADGYTYSQSMKGKTVFTIHAAKAVQHKDGKTILHDVGIVLYGQGQGSSQRVDRIYGSEFEYDQSAEVIRAMGEVHIDLQAPVPADAHAKSDYAAGGEDKGHPADDERLIHVKTSGLVFLKKLGVAATDQDVEFEFHGMTGHARGADYNADSGVLVLQSAVKVNGLQQGQPVVLTATRAELNRQSEQAVLSHAKYVTVGGAGGGRTVEAEKATVHMRRDGSVEVLQGEGGVRLATSDDVTVTGSRGEVRLNEANQPQSAVLTGAVRYVADGTLRKAQGEAEQGRAAFDKAGRLKQVVMTGGVHLHERVRSGETVQWSDRELAARSVDLGLVTDDQHKVQLRDAKAEGDARLTVVNPPIAGAKAGHGGATTSALSGDVLTATFVARDGSTQVEDVHGLGHTVLRRVSDTGAVQTSSGDVMEAKFGSGGLRRTGTVKPARAGAGVGAAEIATAVQQGHVVMTNLPVRKAGDAAGATEQRGTADRAAYDGATEKMTLTGAVQLSDAGSVMWADRVVMEQQTGDAAADGGVKASYQQAGSAGDAVHVLAARAALKHDSGEADFYGVAGRPARLWQGAAQVEAPVLQLEQKERRLIAHGDGQGVAQPVHAVFVSAGPVASGGAASGGAGKQAPKQAAVVRVASREMIYSDVTRRADFKGGVVVQSSDGTMRGQQAVVFLQAAEEGGKVKADGAKAAGGGGFMGGSVERMEATGKIEVEQLGRRALGEQVVYTASDGMFEMTGTPGHPPKMVDDARGTITGASLRFHAGDNSVVVSNGTEHVAGERVRTETRVKQ
jgi:lipopolysaccharide export system protein LptA